VAERFIAENYFGLDTECPGNADPLPHTASKLMRVGILETAQADSFQPATETIQTLVEGAPSVPIFNLGTCV
jgi:hypothetical protein